ncbi:MAG: methyltransferase domain-containing protein [bacterium]
MSAAAALAQTSPLDELQALLDAQAYPPTHTYRIEPFEPTDVLHQRVALMNRLSPQFFERGHALLDVGCNKGFFSLNVAGRFTRVVALDTDAHCIWLCRRIADYLGIENVEFEASSFGRLATQGRFDRVLIGNVHHYIFREAGGRWSWVDKLARLATGLVLIEGPLGMECADMDAAIPAEMRVAFDRDLFFDAMSRHFTLLDFAPTVAYTPDRYLMLFERRPR